MSDIEKRAQALDEARRVRLVKSGDVDVDKYAKPSEIGRQVKEAADWLLEIAQDFEAPDRNPKVYLPWPKTHSKFAFRPGEVTIYAGSNGGGKSLATGQIALGLIQQNQKVCVASFEMKPKRTLYRMLRQFSGENIEFPRYTDKKTFMTRLLDRFISYSHNYMWLYDQQGTTSSQQVIAMARYCAMELGVQHVFIDSLMKCVAGEDDYNAQKYFVDELTAVARDHNIHVHLIHHIRKLQNEEMQPNKNDIKGTGAIADQVDNVLLMWRNKKKEHEIQNGGIPDVNKPDAMLMCEKQRNGEAEDWFSLWYHKDSQQFVEASGGVPMSFDDRGAF